MTWNYEEEPPLSPRAMSSLESGEMPRGRVADEVVHALRDVGVIRARSRFGRERGWLGNVMMAIAATVVFVAGVGVGHLNATQDQEHRRNRFKHELIERKLVSRDVADELAAYGLMDLNSRERQLFPVGDPLPSDSRQKALERLQASAAAVVRLAPESDLGVVARHFLDKNIRVAPRAASPKTIWF